MERLVAQHFWNPRAVCLSNNRTNVTYIAKCINAEMHFNLLRITVITSKLGQCRTVGYLWSTSSEMYNRWLEAVRHTLFCCCSSVIVIKCAIGLCSRLQKLTRQVSCLRHGTCNLMDHKIDNYELKLNLRLCAQAFRALNFFANLVPLSFFVWLYGVGNFFYLWKQSCWGKVSEDVFLRQVVQTSWHHF